MGSYSMPQTHVKILLWPWLMARCTVLVAQVNNIVGVHEQIRIDWVRKTVACNNTPTYAKSVSENSCYSVNPQTGEIWPRSPRFCVFWLKRD
ncbi:hypothetical protein Acel_1621 [Acidothermus cellulolyticus 11B]|uniref:Uncharacterized protein n=1 Tax=Acidothermus cellulolyticus (strain ATCC 43068 / DSM 8971 / 11B) TaxID=351607 RepID=A0LVD3_ACIC1|nr:hypothetical protein Acel_1621 [Acidothermus cellulolyticus 11B]